MLSPHFCDTAEENVSTNDLIAERPSGTRPSAMLPVLRRHLGSLKFELFHGATVDPGLIDDLELRIRALEKEAATH